MSPWSFQHKHCHLAMTALGRRVFREDAIEAGIGSRRIRHALQVFVDRMTPARFDFLYAISLEGKRCTLRQLRKHLGLHPSTISKMAKRLAQLGFVRRYGDDWDRRRVYVQFTRMGRKAFKRAFRVVFDQAVVPGVFARLFRTEDARLMHFEQSYDIVNTFRRAVLPPDKHFVAPMLYRIPDNPFD